MTDGPHYYNGAKFTVRMESRLLNVEDIIISTK